MRRIMIAAAIALVVLSAGCGSQSAAQPDVVEAGQVDIKLPPGWTVTSNGATRPAGAAGATDPAAAVTGAAAATGDAATGDTVPLAKEDPQTTFFKSVKVFQQCLSDLGTKFIGIPDAAHPDAPQNDPNYLKSLGTCAAKSNILQSMKDLQTAQDAMSPSDIKKQNEGYLKWRDCMIGRGWGIPKPKPDSKGRLFTFGSSGPQFTAPPGQDPISSPDFQECIDEVTPK